MSIAQSLKIYEILQRHFKNDDDAKIVAQEIEQKQKFIANQTFFLIKMIYQL